VSTVLSLFDGGDDDDVEDDDDDRCGVEIVLKQSVQSLAAAPAARVAFSRLPGM